MSEEEREMTENEMQQAVVDAAIAVMIHGDVIE